MNATIATSLLLMLLTANPSVCWGQQAVKANASTNGPVPVKKPADLTFKHQSFTFVRIQYSNDRQSSTWAIDFPDAELNFSARFQKETGLKSDRDGKVMTLTNSELKNYPFIYIVEGAEMRLSMAEGQSLREYLLGGGFLMVDDFWGEASWNSFNNQIKHVFPDREPVELPIDHPVFHCFYDLKKKPQVPNVLLGTASLDPKSPYFGRTWEREDAREPHYRGLFDDRGRLMAIFCHNTDLGDGWEREGESEHYFREFSLEKAYPMGINIVVYALTH